MPTYQGIGLMSGTSLDGIDLAHCAFTETDGNWTFELLHAETIPFDEKWYARLRCLDDQSAAAFAKTNVYFGHHLGRTVVDFCKQHKIRPQFVASHGQTIFHQPHSNFTAQIGDGETMAIYLPCPLVTNFRNKDVALGGQGAPLVPFGEKMLFPEHRLFLNLGGIANLSYDDLAFDICPCNMALNWLARLQDPAQEYDKDGTIARSGEVDLQLWDELDELEYYSVQPPKSLGAEWFQQYIIPLIGEEEIPLADRMHTYVRHITRQVQSSLAQVGARRQPIIITGGGTHNEFLMETLTQALKPLDLTPVELPRDVIDFKEAIIFAFLGLQTLLGRPNTLASVTGAQIDTCSGSIHLPPKGFNIPLI